MQILHAKEFIKLIKKRSSKMKYFHETVVIDDNNGKGFCFEMTSFW